MFGTLIMHFVAGFVCLALGRLSWVFTDMVDDAWVCGDISEKQLRRWEYETLMWVGLVLSIVFSLAGLFFCVLCAGIMTETFESPFKL